MFAGLLILRTAPGESSTKEGPVAPPKTFAQVAPPSVVFQSPFPIASAPV